VSARDAAAAMADGNRLRAAGRVPEAIEAFSRAAALAPTAADAHYNLGIVLRQSGDLARAALSFARAARLDPNDAHAVQNVVDTLGLAVERGDSPFEYHAPPENASPRAFTIVTCSIDEGRLQRMRASFDAALGAREHEYIVIRDARSLSEGYERGLRAAKHDLVVFSHDDVELASAHAFDAIDTALRAHDIVGLAGSRRAAGPSAMWSGHPHLFGTVAYPPGSTRARWKATVYSVATGTVAGMQTLDGLFFAARRACALSVGFDAVTFDAFHFYDLDFVYRAQRAGNSVAISTEVLAIHASEGSYDDAWRAQAERFMRKYPELAAPAGKSFYFGRDFDTREEVVRFHQQFNALGAMA
jgi:tetratricopeptide (TPR) repeat protein